MGPGRPRLSLHPVLWRDHVVEKTLRFGVQLVSVRSGDISRTVACGRMCQSVLSCVGLSTVELLAAGRGQAEASQPVPAKC